MFSFNTNLNIPETAGGPGGRDRMLENHLYFLHISSSYVKILRETNFHKQISKAKDGEKKKEREKYSRDYINYLKILYAKILRKQIFVHGRFPEVGQKQKTERKRKREKKRGETERW